MKIKYDEIALQQYNFINIVEDMLAPMVREINDNSDYISDYISHSTLISASLNLIFNGRAKFIYVHDFGGYRFTINGVDETLTEHYLFKFKNNFTSDEQLILSHSNDHFTVYLLQEMK